MAAPTKEQLLSKAKEYGLEVAENAKAADIKADIAEYEAANPPAPDENAPVEQPKAKVKGYVVTQYFMDALKPGVAYNKGDILPDDISDDRIQTMLDNNLIKAK